MSEHELGEPEPMSASMREYVDAFAAVEQPEPGAGPSTWRAIDDELKPDRRRVLWIAAASAVGLAAAIILLIGGLTRSVLDRAPSDASVQAPHEGVPEATGGASSIKQPRARPSRARDERLAPAPLEPNPTATEAERPGVVPGTEVTRPSAETAEPKPTKRARPVRKSEPVRDTSLAAELERFKAAKRAYDSGNARDALAQLDAFAKDFPHGALRREAQLLRAEALCAAGRTAKAEKLRDRFLEAHPGSPLSSRMRDVCR